MRARPAAHAKRCRGLGLLALAGLALAGCAQQTGWVRPGGDALSNADDLAACRREARLAIWNSGQGGSIFPGYGVTPLDDPWFYGQPSGYPYGRNDPSYRLRQDAAFVAGDAMGRKLMGDCLAAKGFQPGAAP